MTVEYLNDERLNETASPSIRLAESEEEVARCFPVMHQLRRG